MNLNSKPSSPDPPNPDQLMDSDDKTETTEKVLEYYYKAKIDHRYPNFHMIWEILKEECIYLQSSIDIFNKYKLRYS